MPRPEMVREYIKSALRETKRIFTTDIRIQIPNSDILLRVVAVPGHRVVKLMPEVDGIFHAPIRVVTNPTPETDEISWGDLLTGSSIKIPRIVTVVTIQDIKIVNGKEEYTNIGTFDLLNGAWINTTL